MDMAKEYARKVSRAKKEYSSSLNNGAISSITEAGEGRHSEGRAKAIQERSAQLKEQTNK